MIKYSDVYKRIISIIRQNFNEDVYTNDTDDVKRPCFIIELVAYPSSYHNNNTKDRGCAIKITHLDKVKDTAKSLEIAEKVETAFGKTIEINKRHVLVKEISHSWLGSKADILQITAELNWLNEIEDTSNYEIMKHLHTKGEINE